MQQRTKPDIPCRENRHCISAKKVVAFVSVHSACPFVDLIANHNAVIAGCQHEYLSSLSGDDVSVGRYWIFEQLMLDCLG